MFSGKIAVDDVMKAMRKNGDVVLTNTVAKKVPREVPKSAVANSDDSEKTPADGHLRILAFGDTMLGRYVRTLMNKYGMDYIFLGVKSKDGEWFYKNADLVFTNFEGPINGKGTSGGTSMIFSFNEDTAMFLKSYGFDIVSIANNHALDQGWDGRKKTVDALNKVGLGWCGHPSEAEKGSVYYGEVSGAKVAFVCFQDVTAKLNLDDAVSLIKEVKSSADFVIVSVHWGSEYVHKANARQVEFGHAFVDGGADFVIGHHPHVVEGFEKYNGKFIFYSLGNFVFDQYWSNDTQEELSIGIDLLREDGGLKTVVDLFPMRSDKSKSRLMTDNERAKWIKKFISYGNYDEETKVQIENFEVVIGE